MNIDSLCATGDIFPGYEVGQEFSKKQLVTFRKFGQKLVFCVIRHAFERELDHAVGHRVACGYSVIDHGSKHSPGFHG